MTFPSTSTRIDHNDEAASTPLFIDLLSHAGPSVYGTDVWNKAALQTLLRAKTGDGRTIVGIVPQYSGATYYAEYDPTNDIVKVTVKSTGVENATADISAQTFRWLILSN